MTDMFTPPPQQEVALFAPPAAEASDTHALAALTRSKRPAPATEAYRIYEGLGSERSFTKLLTALRALDSSHFKATDATCLRQFKRWAQRDGWRERVRAFDQRHEEELRRQAEQAFVDMNRLQAEGARGLWLIAARQLLELLRLDDVTIARYRQAQELLVAGLPLPKRLQDYADPQKMRLIVSPHIRALAWREAIEVERLARGAATEIAFQQHAGGVRISVIAADQQGRDLPSPFSLDPNALLAQDRRGLTAEAQAALDEDEDEDEWDDEGDDEDADEAAAHQ